MGGLWEPLWQPVSSGSSSGVASDDLTQLSLGGSLVDPVNLAGARGIYVVDSYGYVAVWEDGQGQSQVGSGQGRFAIIDFALDTPVLMASVQHDMLRGPRGVDVAGDVAAVVSSLSGGSLTLWDVTNKKAPTLLGSSVDAKLVGAHRVHFVGRWLYVTGLDWFTIWDVSNPAALALVGSLTVTAKDIYGMAIKGDTAFLAASASNEYLAVDITNKAAPSLISAVSLPGSGPHWMTVDGRYGYTANSGTDSVDIFDVSNPAAMVLVGTVSDSRLNGAHTLAKLGNYVLACAQSYSGFAVVDVTNPAAPVVVGSVTDSSVMDGVRSMHVAGGRCFWAAVGPQATPFTTGSVGWIDLHGLEVSTMTVGSMRADEGEVRGELQAGSVSVHDGVTVGPGGMMSLGPVAAEGKMLGRAATFDLSVFGKAVSTITFSTFTQLSTRYNAGSRKGSGGQNDEVVFRLPVDLLGGTWTIVLLHTATTDRGIYTIAGSVDGVTFTTLTTIDGYAGVLTQTRSEVPGVVVPDLTRFIRLKMATKNASSSNYNSEISGLYGLRTGA